MSENHSKSRDYAYCLMLFTMMLCMSSITYFFIPVYVSTSGRNTWHHQGSDRVKTRLTFGQPKATRHAVHRLLVDEYGKSAYAIPYFSLVACAFVPHKRC